MSTKERVKTDIRRGGYDVTSCRKTGDDSFMKILGNHGFLSLSDGHPRGESMMILPRSAAVVLAWLDSKVACREGFMAQTLSY